MLQLSNISDKEIQKNMSRLNRFLEATSYRINDDRIIIYINELKKIYQPKTVRHHLITIKRFLKFVGYPSAELIKLPKVPKRRKMVIKPNQIRKILERADLQIKAAVLLAATSGLRAEELFKLTLEDIDIEGRTIYVGAEIAKDYEDRITFFSEEARLALQNYLSVRQSNSIHLFPESTIRKKIRKYSRNLRIKHMRKFFSQQSDRLGMPTAIKKMLMGHAVDDVDLGHYDFQDEEELKKIYDKYWRDFRIL
ncbi:site-specific integrase [Archaeoglobales archaeon]|nr:MAG: site-specific integrase [Archaeoglobales archaeon]